MVLEYLPTFTRNMSQSCQFCRYSSRTMEQMGRPTLSATSGENSQVTERKSHVGADCLTALQPNGTAMANIRRHALFAVCHE